MPVIYVIAVKTAIVNKEVNAFPPAIASLSLMAGAASVSGFLCQLVALNSGGRLSIINIIGNLSLLIPILYHYNDT